MSLPKDLQTSPHPRFLPEYDNLVLSHVDRTWAVPEEHRSSIFLSAPLGFGRRSSWPGVSACARPRCTYHVAGLEGVRRELALLGTRELGERLRREELARKT